VEALRFARKQTSKDMDAGLRRNDDPEPER
jgi:hypothetical protein